jgi:nitrite reductase/ring-hydroxylating ferredoxin subunit
MNFRAFLPARWYRVIPESDLDDRCPHAGASLHGAEAISNGAIVCPRHGLELFVDAGPCPDDAIRIAKFRFRIHDDAVEVDSAALHRRPAA